MDYSLRQTIPFKYLEAPSIHEVEPNVVVVFEAQENWMDEIIDYIQNGRLPRDHHLARKLVEKHQDIRSFGACTTDIPIQNFTLYMSHWKLACRSWVTSTPECTATMHAEDRWHRKHWLLDTIGLRCDRMQLVVPKVATNAKGMPLWTINFVGPLKKAQANIQ